MMAIYWLGQQKPRAGPLQFLRKRRPETPAHPSRRELIAWADSLEVLLSCEHGVKYFRAFLSEEFAEENLDFWVAVENFRKSDSTKKPTIAEQIFSEFVSSSAPKQINVDGMTRTMISQNLTSPTPRMFDSAQRRVFLLMEGDTYRRFLNSAEYRDLLKD